ncbi:MAG: tyrosine-type recombinase/integrase [Dehalococcoidia bacterium]
MTRTLQSLAKRAGVGHLRIHDLRHFHASVMLQQRQSPVLVSKRLGHANVSITMDIYSHLLPGWQKDAADAFARAMKKGI